MRATPAALLTALLLTAAPAAARAADDELVVTGHGFGHGVGMSQWGAYGLAQHGSDYREILAHYYTGTDLGTAPRGQRVRVLLADGRRSVRVRGVRRAGRRTTNPARTYTATPNGLRGVVLRDGRKVVTRANGPLRLRGSRSTPVEIRETAAGPGGVRNGDWRGVVELRLSPVGALQVINDVGLEDYVRGVVSGESPSSWPADALRAQAVAARTYAITTRKPSPDGAFDQYADTRSQVYKGVTAETDTTDAAVDATRGQVVIYDGEPVVTYFFSSSGGQTENVEFGFPGEKPQPWLKSVDDPYDDAAPNHDWTIRMSLSRAERKLGRLLDGDLKDIEIDQRGVSPRIVKATVVGSDGRTRVTGPQLRAALDLPDTWASFAIR